MERGGPWVGFNKTYKQVLTMDGLRSSSPIVKNTKVFSCRIVLLPLQLRLTSYKLAFRAGERHFEMKLLNLRPVETGF